jgi:hypothetical protein
MEGLQVAGVVLFIFGILTASSMLQDGKRALAAEDLATVRRIERMTVLNALGPMLPLIAALGTHQLHAAARGRHRRGGDAADDSAGGGSRRAACAAHARRGPALRATPPRTGRPTRSARRASGSARSRSFPRFEEFRALVRRDRPAEKVALHLVALVRLEELELLLVLHAFRDDLEVQAVAERDDGFRQDAAVRPARGR